MLKLYSLSDFNAEQFDKSPFTLHEAGEDFISLLLMFQERIMFAKSVQKFLGEIITSSMYTQPTKVCYDLLPVQYTELTHQQRTFLVCSFPAVVQLFSIIAM